MRVQGDLSCTGHPTIITPNLDKMASEGARFTQWVSLCVYLMVGI